VQRLDLSDRIDPPIGLLQQIPRQPDIPSTSVRILQPDRFSSSIYPSPRGRLPCACQYPTRSSVTPSIRRIEPRGSHRQGRLGGGRRLGRCGVARWRHAAAIRSARRRIAAEACRV